MSNTDETQVDWSWERAQAASLMDTLRQDIKNGWVQGIGGEELWELLPEHAKVLHQVSVLVDEAGELTRPADWENYGHVGVDRLRLGSVLRYNQRLAELLSGIRPHALCSPITSEINEDDQDDGCCEALEAQLDHAGDPMWAAMTLTEGPNRATMILEALDKLTTKINEVNSFCILQRSFAETVSSIASRIHHHPYNGASDAWTEASTPLANVSANITDYAERNKTGTGLLQLYMDALRETIAQVPSADQLEDVRLAAVIDHGPGHLRDSTLGEIESLCAKALQRDLEAKVTGVIAADEVEGGASEPRPSSESALIMLMEDNLDRGDWGSSGGGEWEETGTADRERNGSENATKH